MTSQKSLPTQFTGIEYVRIETAAPDLGKAEYFNHPAHGWVRVLDTVTEIEADIVVAAYEDPATGEFQGLYKTWYSETVELLAPTDLQCIRETIQETAKEVEPADALISQLQH